MLKKPSVLLKVLSPTKTLCKMPKRNVLGTLSSPKRTKRYSTMDNMPSKDKKSVVPGKQQLNSELLEDILELKDSDEEGVQVVFDSKSSKQEETSSKPASTDKSSNRMSSGPPSSTDAVLLERVWDYSRLGQEGRPPSMRDALDLTVMSYNVLSDLLMKRHKNLYPNSKEEDLAWDTRWKRIVQEVQTYNPDIFCLQEVQVDHWESHFVPSLTRLGYSGVYKQRTGNDKCDGCAIFYRRDKVSLKSYHGVEFHQPGIWVLDRDNVALLAKFEHRQTGQDFRSWRRRPFVVATTHILYNQRRTDIKLGQLALLFAELDRFAKTPSENGRQGSSVHLPVILTGDFNMTPDNAIVRDFIQQGSIDYHEGLQPQPRTYTPWELPNTLGITDHCQHAGPFNLLRNGQRPIVLTSCCQEADAENSSVPPGGSREQQMEHRLEQQMAAEYRAVLRTGRLSHPFGLRSVYRNDRGREASSNQGSGNFWVVDYIFYSTVYHSKHNKQVEGNLKLISRLRLPTESKCRELGGMPNPLCPSDHISLVAKFILT